MDISFVNTILTSLRKSFIIATIVVLTFGYSSIGFSRVAFADDTVVCPTVTGTTSPTGVAARTFVYDPDTCLWSNAYYSWDASTKQYTPLYSQDPVYNPDTNSWEHTVWEYVSSEGQYVARILSTPATVAEQTSAGDSPTAATVPQTSDGTGGSLAESASSSTISNTGTDSDNSILANNNAIINTDLSNNAAVLTTLDSDATSGDASILSNTTAGNALTGDAAAVAYILNMIQSSWDPSNGDIAMFNADLNNNYFGDLLFDPSLVLNTGTSSNNTIGYNGNLDLTLNVENDASIENNINLNATSGNATVNGNTTAGDVTTGDANATANVLNMINSLITSGQSFLGSINLYGDLNGDILLPQGLLAQIMDTGTGSANTINNANDTNVDANVNTTSSITNNTNLTSLSGSADANGNTHVGNVTTGDADTNVNQMNLVGQNITGSKGLLVFVNVLGTWVGMIFNSPSSSLITGTGTNSTNAIDTTSNLDADIDIDNNYEIVNNINLAATTGDATANGNTTVGNVTTGNATTGVNLLNMIDSSVNFSDWFGVLFINVFGHWDGSFGVNTAAGNTSVPQTTGRGAEQQLATASTSVAGATTSSSDEVFRFVASSSAGGSSTTPNKTATSSTSTSTSREALGASIPKEIASMSAASSRWPAWVMPVGGTTTAILLLGFERYLALRRQS